MQRRSFGLVPGKQTILIIGGSLGARTLNVKAFWAIYPCSNNKAAYSLFRKRVSTK